MESHDRYLHTARRSLALHEQDRFQKGVAALPEERAFGNNTEAKVMLVAAHVLTAKVARAGWNGPKSVEDLRLAVAAAGTLGYDEPADWYYPPTREALGAALLGLTEALKKQSRMDEAALAGTQFQAAWSKADGPLTLADLF